MGFSVIARKRRRPVILGTFLDPYGRFRDAIETAYRAIGFSSDVVHLVSERFFHHALRRLERFHRVSLIAMATTEFRVLKESLWTETFVNAENRFTKAHPEAVMAHEFAHIRQHFHMGGMLELAFVKPDSKQARKMASIFLMGLEEVLADSLLPSKWRIEKNRAILYLLGKCPEAPHPLFLSVLRTTMEPENGREAFRKLMERLEFDPLKGLLYETALKYFRYFYTKGKVNASDIKTIEEGINGILRSLYGIPHSCRVVLKPLIFGRDSCSDRA